MPRWCEGKANSTSVPRRGRSFSLGEQDRMRNLNYSVNPMVARWMEHTAPGEISDGVPGIVRELRQQKPLRYMTREELEMWENVLAGFCRFCDKNPDAYGRGGARLIGRCLEDVRLAKRSVGELIAA